MYNMCIFMYIDKDIVIVRGYLFFIIVLIFIEKKKKEYLN